MELNGTDHENTLIAAMNYASSLEDSERFEEAKSILREMVPVAQRVLGESHEVTLRMRWNYAAMLYNDTGATFRDLLEAVRRLEKLTLTAQRVLGRFHPVVGGIVGDLVLARAALRAPRRRREPVSTAN